VLILAAMGGVAASVAHAFATWPKGMASSQGLSSSDAELIKQGAAFETCVVFFAVTYLTGRIWALLFSAKDVADEIRRNSRWHLRILGAFSILLALMRAWFVGKRGWKPVDDLVAFGFIAAIAALTVVFQVGRRKNGRTL
jgi:cytochrome bd-type quinol oxidase subunit 2